MTYITYCDSFEFWQTSLYDPYKHHFNF